MDNARATTLHFAANVLMQRSTCDSESKHIQTRNAIGIYLKQSIDLHRKIYSLDNWAPQSEYYTTNFTDCVKALRVRIYFLCVSFLSWS